MTFSKILYRLFLGAYDAGAFVSAFFSPKTERWVQGRKSIIRHWQNQLDAVPNRANRPLIWLHASSLGEFEQVWPVAESLRVRHPDIVVAVSFFSPSGYEVVSRKGLADACGYLPFDNDHRLERFVELLNPRLVLWAKYDFWYNVLKIIYLKRIPALLVSAVFRKGQPFFKPWGRLHREMLQCFYHIFVQDENSQKLLASIGLPPDLVTLSGDTRFDRVAQLAMDPQPVSGIENWVAGRQPVMVAGSTWPEDHSLLAEAFSTIQNHLLIIAPHEVDDNSIGNVLTIFPAATRYSQLRYGDENLRTTVLVIDNVGMLSRLYCYGKVAYVGGGFSKTGVHNVLEPAACGIPVLFGANHKKYLEVGQLLQSGGGVEVGVANDVSRWMALAAENNDQWKSAGIAAGAFVANNTGATQTIADYIQRNRLLINA